MPALLALVALLLAAVPAAAREVRIALAVDHDILAAALRADLGLQDGPATLWGDVGGCQALLLKDLGVATAGDRVQVTARGEGHVGFDVASFCLFPLSWEGVLDARGRPQVDPDWRLRLRDVHSELLARDGKPSFVSRRLGGYVGPEIDARLTAFAFDLAPPADLIREVLRAVAPPERAEPVLAAVASLRPLDAAPGPDGVVVHVAMDVPDAPPAPPAPEPALDPAARERFARALDAWDGFLTFVVKDLGLLDREAAVRTQLFELLLRSRHTLVDVVAQGPRPGEDPVRRLFLDAWEELRGIVRRAAAAGALGDHAMRYLAFLAAGDALAALEAAAPGLGIDVSADGLRRLARALDPGADGDPLAVSEAPDPALRALFGFHEPESSPPGVGDAPALDALDAGAPPPAAPPAPADTPPATTPADVPATTSTTAPTTLPASTTTTTTLPPAETSSWWWPLVATAAAAAEPPPGPALPEIARALDRWVPPPDQLLRYRDLVSRLLDLVAANERTRSDVAPRFQELYRQLVRTTAWQESCWRQFVAQNGRVVPMRSETGDVGIMQINVRVWRGFFDVKKLEWDIVYNAGAGAEILAQLLDRYGAKEADRRDGHAARACYSAYNGGPAAFTRYRSNRRSGRDRAVDDAFWDKFRVTAAGKELDQVLCM